MVHCFDNAPEPISRLSIEEYSKCRAGCRVHGRKPRQRPNIFERIELRIPDITPTEIFPVTRPAENNPLRPATSDGPPLFDTTARIGRIV
jgi:hypothetical protein